MIIKITSKELLNECFRIKTCVIFENGLDMLLASIDVGLPVRTIPWISVVLKSQFNVLCCNEFYQPQIFCIAEREITWIWWLFKQFYHTGLPISVLKHCLWMSITRVKVLVVSTTFFKNGCHNTLWRVKIKVWLDPLTKIVSYSTV